MHRYYDSAMFWVTASGVLLTVGVAVGLAARGTVRGIGFVCVGLGTLAAIWALVQYFRGARQAPPPSSPVNPTRTGIKANNTKISLRRSTIKGENPLDLSGGSLDVEDTSIGE